MSKVLTNAWELSKEFYKLDEEILELVDKKKKSPRSKAESIDREIDRRLARQLEIKHKLERIN